MVLVTKRNMWEVLTFHAEFKIHILWCPESLRSLGRCMKTYACTLGCLQFIPGTRLSIWTWVKVYFKKMNWSIWAGKITASHDVALMTLEKKYTPWVNWVVKKVKWKRMYSKWEALFNGKTYFKCPMSSWKIRLWSCHSAWFMALRHDFTHLHKGPLKSIKEVPNDYHTQAVLKMGDANINMKVYDWLVSLRKDILTKGTCS